jgi:hypothetical protein
MQATHIPAPQDRGLWYIERTNFRTNCDDSVILQAAKFMGMRLGGYTQWPEIEPVMTSLSRWTDATLHLGHGEAVMSDDPTELRKHLPIVLAAHGRVLVTGLGLGCVVRGLLARPEVTHVDVVEIDADVLAMVAPTFDGEPRVTIHHGDALTIDWPAGTRWDFAWHDVWNETPETQVLHAQLLARYRGIARQQGAWNFPRWLKRRWPWPLIGASTERTYA